MSHMSIIRSQIKNLKSVEKACKILGYKFEKDQKEYKWYGKFMNDYPLPEGIKKEDLGKCLHAIKVPGANYEIGVIKDPFNNKDFTFLYDFWGSGKLHEIVGENLWKLTQRYSIEEAKRAAKLKGYTTIEKIEKDKIRLRILMD